MQEYNYPKDHTPDYLSILVPNVDNVRTDFLTETISKQGKVRDNFKIICQQFCSYDTVAVMLSLP